VVAVCLFFLFSEESGSPDFLTQPGKTVRTGRMPEPSPPVEKPVERSTGPAGNEGEIPLPEQPGTAPDPGAPTVVSAFRSIPIVGASVFLETAGGEASRTTTDDHGQFKVVPGIADGDSVRIEAPGFHPLEMSVAEAPARGKGGMVFKMKPAAMIRGRVVDCQGIPQDWARVQVGVVIRDGSGATIGVPWNVRERVITKNGGEFRIEGLDPRGRYLLSGFLSRLGIGVVQDVVPEVGEAASLVTIKLGGEASIHAIVVDSKGNPVFGPRAVLTGKPDGLPGEVTADDHSRAVADIMHSFGIRFSRSSFSSQYNFTGWKSGTAFAFEKLPAGDFVLQVQAKGFRTYTRKIRVKQHDRVQHEVRMVPEDVAVSGVVTDSRGRPIPGVDVSILTDGSSYSGYLSTATGPDGSFRIRGPTEWISPLRLMAATTGYEKATIMVPAGQKRVAVQLRRYGLIRGKVQMEGKGSGEVIFDFIRSHPQTLQERRIFPVRDRWKQFSFDLAPGTWTVRVTAKGFQPYSGKFELFEGAEKSGLDIWLKAE